MKFNTSNLYIRNLKNYSQKHLCDFVCVWFCEKLSWFSFNEKNNIQTIIYARDHIEKLKVYLLKCFCGVLNTKNNIKFNFCLSYNNLLGGEL